MKTVLSAEYAPESLAVVGLTLVHGRRQSAQRWLDAKLDEVRNDPEAALKWLEDALLRGLAELSSYDRQPEHSKQTGRQAGGGKLTKGS